MSRWHKPDPPDVLWPPERPPLQRPPGNWAVRGYVAWQKWERDEPLSAQDVLALGMSEQELNRLAEQERNKFLARRAEERRANRLSARVRRFLVHLPLRLAEVWSELSKWWWSLPVRSG